jgi:hypothetical protein
VLPIIENSDLDKKFWFYYPLQVFFFFSKLPIHPSLQWWTKAQRPWTPGQAPAQTYAKEFVSLRYAHALAMLEG